MDRRWRSPPAVTISTTLFIPRDRAVTQSGGTEVEDAAADISAVTGNGTADEYQRPTVLDAAAGGFVGHDVIRHNAVDHRQEGILSR